MSFRRIVFGLGAEPAERALAAATDIARATEAGLLALFVEERELLDLAGLPFAREVTFPAATARALDPASMARALRARAQAAEARLARSLAGVALEWRFEVVRGSATSAVLEAAGERDLAVISLTAGARVDAGRARTAALQSVRQARRAALLLGPRAVPRAPLVAVLAPGAPARETLAALGALARRYDGADLAVLALPGSASDAELAAAAEALGLRLRMRRLDSTAHLADALREAPAGLLVLAGGAGIWEIGDALVDSAPCPVMVLPAPAG